MNEPTTTDNPLTIFDDPLTIFDDPEVKAAFNAFADALAAALRLTSAIVSATVRLLNNWWFTIKSTAVPARWAHLARYARKRRTRAKYQRVISRRWAELLGTVMAT